MTIQITIMIAPELRSPAAEFVAIEPMETAARKYCALYVRSVAGAGLAVDDIDFAAALRREGQLNIHGQGFTVSFAPVAGDPPAQAETPPDRKL